MNVSHLGQQQAVHCMTESEQWDIQPEEEEKAETAGVCHPESKPGFQGK